MLVRLDHITPKVLYDKIEITDKLSIETKQNTEVVLLRLLIIDSKLVLTKVNTNTLFCLATIARWNHLTPFRTQK